jgi:hypothetical protein
MRSQVQVLGGPPPIVAAHSAAGSGPGGLAVGLGRAGAARPSPPAPPVAPPGPPTRALGSATATQRGQGPQTRTAATRPVPPPGATACSRAHRAAARDGPSPRRPGLPGRSAGKRGRRGPHPTGGPGPPATSHRPPRRRQRRRRPGLLDRRSSRRRPGSHRGRQRFRWSRSPGQLDLGPRRHRLSMGGDGRVRTDGADTARLDTARVDSRRLSAGPCGRRPQVTGHRTAGQPDPGRQDRMGGHRRLNRATDAVACLLAGSTTATTPDRSISAGRSSGQMSSGRATTRTAQRQGRRGHPRCFGRAWPPPRQSAADGTPPSSWRLGALLSSDDYGSSVERTATLHPLGQALREHEASEWWSWAVEDLWHCD